ncbi:hypothetical protein Y032_0153g2943 [Ancylostoma ceylanicum]|uniref:Uncharacterized protein n=1 Tax=Ancylostoma ceylanicum TaxID=53326 RepID=A0A016SZL7_9BILA|nr:hypothetical protein Y032_0153g2943 [Ancylostoma ceylanicum]
MGWDGVCACVFSRTEPMTPSSLASRISLGLPIVSGMVLVRLAEIARVEVRKCTNGKEMFTNAFWTQING